MTTADNIRWEIKQRTDRIAEATKSIGNLTRHVALLKDEQTRLQQEAKTLRADLLKIEPTKEISL